MHVGVWKCAMAAPNDVSEIKVLIASGSVEPATIVARIGKTVLARHDAVNAQRAGCEAGAPND
ncbi:ring-opening amidohydrolase [Bosea sp. PAMC 26642]|uniref:ring-opening amidohydrolase n=1 Tax=Bosea sp. (strain PAMC 26642) TaxID=1792307 RepID=UPI00076FEF66|nr:ring-opening amidohydrolase [Bosea sp. PAMC 26642]AMJ61702.1 hypothetical protein AXW83_16565 [Bosea sp. PAMC 26642]